MRFMTLLAVSLVMVMGASAVCHADMYSDFRNRHDEAVHRIVQCTAKGCARDKWADSIYDLVQSEEGMLSYGESYVSKDLYSPLGEGLAPSQYDVLGWRILKRRLASFGFEVGGAASALPAQPLN